MDYIDAHVASQDKETLIKDARIKEQKLALAIKDLEAEKKAYLKKADAAAVPAEERAPKLNELADRLAALTVTKKEVADTIRRLQTAINTAKAKGDKENNTAEIIGCIKEFLSKNPSCAYIIDDDEFVWVEDYSTTEEQQNVVVRKVKNFRMVDYLANKLNIPLNDIDLSLVKEAFNEAGRSFEMLRYTCDAVRWTDAVYKPIDHLREFFIDKMVVDGDHHPAFDMLMHSLSGGKKENQDHIEQWVLHKLFNWNKPITTPDVVIVGHVGGNGKGILIKIMKSVLPSCLVGRANNKTLNGNFNSAMYGKLLVILDDQDRDETSLDIIKEQAGADEMIYEQKGKDQVEAENTHSKVFFSNVLPFNLTPDGGNAGVDRRFSIMRTSITFLETIQKEFPDATGDDLKVFAGELVKNVLWNRVEIARWVKHLQSKHPQVYPGSTLLSLHGADYEYFVNQSADLTEFVFNSLVKPLLAQKKAVPLKMIEEVLLANGATEKDVQQTTLGTKINKLIAKNNLEVMKDRKSWKLLWDGFETKSFPKSTVYFADGTTEFDFDFEVVSTQKYNEIMMDGKDGRMIAEGCCKLYKN